MTKRLLSDDEDPDHLKIRINKDYAVKFEEKKKREELSILQDKYKDYSSGSEKETESESDEEEDEEGSLLTPQVDAKILNTLAIIRAKDPIIYSKDVDFFDEKDIASKSDQKQREKVTLKQFQSKQLLDGALLSESENEQPAKYSKSKFASEQDQIRADLKRAFYENRAPDNEEEEVLAKKTKTSQDLEKEDTEYREFLLQNLKNNPNAQEAMQDWIAYSGSNGGKSEFKQSDNDRFLIEYIMSRGWLDKSASHNVEEIVRAVEESEEEVEKAETFEEQYNFRYEQPNATLISSYPREIEDSMRRKESKRQKERDNLKKRKEEEKVKQEEELKRLKNLKRGELRKRAEKLVRISGTEAIKKLLDDSGSDSDGFDLEKHDQKMAQIFNQDYYEEAGNDDAVESASDQEQEEIKTKPIKKLQKKLSESAGDQELIRKTIEEALYKLDYEDRIDDLSFRFKYRPVPSSSYGLEVSELLSINDKALNRHVSLKKLAPYRPVEQQEKDMRKYGDKRRVWMFRNAMNLEGPANK